MDSSKGVARPIRNCDPSEKIKRYQEHRFSVAGIARANTKIGLANLVYNVNRDLSSPLGRDRQRAVSFGLRKCGSDEHRAVAAMQPFNWFACVTPKLSHWSLLMYRTSCLTLIGLFIAAPAFAAGGCSTAPAAKFMPKATLESQLKTEGLTVRRIKTEKGCYEVYAVDKAGKKVNFAYNAETLEKLANAEAGEN
jgi:hypothetical protein